jgi:serine/threonine protein kinase
MTAPSRIGRYAVLGPLGQGAMGVVYRGRDEALERDVALKVMSAAVADAEGRARFLREARAAARLQHPNIITIYELGEHEGAPFMALELLEGCDLQRAIEAGIRPDPKVSLPVVLQVLAGLGHAHEQGIVHRDVKPSNIFLCKGRPAKIMDFGVARLGGGATTSGGVVGTPYYMSPEQVTGGPLDGRSDLFSAGLILYELVTGEKGFKADSIVSLLYKISHEAPDVSLIPREARWEGVRVVLARALARNVAERYPSAASMAGELREALLALGGGLDGPSASDSGLLIPTAVRHRPTAPIPPPPEEAPAAPRGGRVPILAIGGALALLALGTLVLLVRSRPVPPPLPAPSTLSASQAPTRREPREPSPVPVPGGAGKGPPASLRQAPTSASTPEAPAATPAASTPSLEAPGPPSLERARAALEKGELRGALQEARAVLAQNPEDSRAKALAQNVEAALVVEERIKSAREALQRGDKEAALAEIRLGFAVNPKDPRLIDLFREATQ